MRHLDILSQNEFDDIGTVTLSRGDQGQPETRARTLAVAQLEMLRQTLVATTPAVKVLIIVPVKERDGGGGGELIVASVKSSTRRR